jgi:nucleotide-binding universal stress UspA family protein
MDIKTILVPLDGSQTAEAALPYAEAIAGATGAAVHLLAVVESEAGGPAGRPLQVRQYLGRIGQEAMTAYLDLTAGALRERGITAATTVVTGDPADEITAAAEDTPDAIIVMATHGRGGLDRWLIGSVADKVMRTATRPTLLVLPPQAALPTREVVLRRIMVPLDGSDVAETALAAAGALAGATGATVTLVRVVPWLSTTAALYGYVPELDRMDADAVAAAEDYLAAVKRRLPAGLRGETIVLRGTAGLMLESFALHEDVDLVVMTTHGAGGLRRLVLGSTADRLVRAGAPALLIRAATLAARRFPRMMSAIT